MILSIIIVNWNGKRLTKNCINSILETNPGKIKSGEFEIIVIDNGSADGSVEELKKLIDSIKLIENKENIGYAPACNQGIRIAQGKYILLLGNDTLILNGALEKCISFMEKHSECGAAGCKLLNPDGTVQNNCKRFPEFINGFYTYLSLNKLNRDYDMSWFKYDKTMEVEQISTTFLLIRSSLLKNTGGFNEDYKILYNDVDLCKKIWKSGKKIYFMHNAEVIHYGNQSTKKARFRERKIMYSDIYRYYRKNFGIISIMLLPVLFARLLFVTAIK
jgi:GT2 family glycosyltransferase